MIQCYLLCDRGQKSHYTFQIYYIKSMSLSLLFDFTIVCQQQLSVCPNPLNRKKKWNRLSFPWQLSFSSYVWVMILIHDMINLCDLEIQYGHRRRQIAADKQFLSCNTARIGVLTNNNFFLLLADISTTHSSLLPKSDSSEEKSTSHSEQLSSEPLWTSLEFQLLKDHYLKEHENFLSMRYVVPVLKSATSYHQEVNIRCSSVGPVKG